MNNEEAKFILRAYRPNGQDADDPQFAEALAHARRDPELAQWLDNERALDAAFAAKLRKIPVPADLKAQILAGRKLVKTRALFSRRELLALAALGVAGVSSRFYWYRPWEPRTFAAFRENMTRIMEDGGYALGFRSRELPKISQWLAEHQGHGSLALTAQLEKLPPLGCQVIGWHRRPVSVVCFDYQGNVLHLFILDAKGLPDAPAEGSPVLAKVHNELTAGWSRGGKVYLLGGLNDRDTLQKLL